MHVLYVWDIRDNMPFFSTDVYITFKGVPTILTHAAEVVCNNPSTDAVAYRKNLGKSLGDVGKTDKLGGSDQQENRKRGGKYEENGEGGGRGGKPTTTTGTPNSVRERSAPGSKKATRHTRVPTTTNAMLGGDQPARSAVSKTVLQEEKRTDESTGNTAWPPRTFVRQRPTSAAAGTWSASATNGKGRDFVSPAALTARRRLAFEDHHETDGRARESSASRNRSGSRLREVPVCWGAEIMPGRRPTPLGKTNTSKNAIKVCAICRVGT